MDLNEEYQKYINLLEGEVFKKATLIVEKLSLLKITSWNNYYIIDDHLVYFDHGGYVGLTFEGYYQDRSKYMKGASNEIKIQFLKEAPNILSDIDEIMYKQIADIKELCDV